MRRFVGLCLAVWWCIACSSSAGGPAQGGGGADGVLGSGGAAGREPSKANVFVDQISASHVDKVDILFMIDNSPSMADKQEILKSAVPVLLARLVSPLCLDSDGKPSGAGAKADGTCGPPGSTPEFAPIADIHIGIVSSSLGAHGGSICSTESASPGSNQNDRGHLIGTMRSGLSSWQSSGFLAWDPAGTANVPPGENDPAKLSADFAAMVQATGEHGCGYEASLESWYRFLIDPEPPMEVTQAAGVSVRQGVDADLLAQRKAFLRPDSLLSIVMLSDENDCSIRDDGLGWMVSSGLRMPKATAACASNPNDKCCRSCAATETSPPSGCQALSADSTCKDDASSPPGTWDALHDAPNLRCYRQRQRFGFDLLYPTQRYVDGLKQRTLTLPSDPTKTVINPLFDGGEGKPGRSPSLVFLAGIVGVPWQDIATSESLTTNSSIQYLTALELVDQNRWPQLIGNPTASPPLPPSDPFMIESTEPRQGANPNTPFQIAPADSPNPKANPINGHEQNIPDLDDLQYACAFPLTTPKVCAIGDSLCDCAPAKDGTTAALQATNSPLCQPPGGGMAGTTQYLAKAYPGTRELTVLKDFGENAIVASICPKITTSTSPMADPNYGYNPAVSAIIERLKEGLGEKCLPRPLITVPDKGGSLSPATACHVIEVQAIDRCDCAQAGRSAAPSALVSSVLQQLALSGTCGPSPGQPKCDAANFCLCQINQETAADLDSCVANQPTTRAGFCYIDDSTSSALRQCPLNQQQKLRFVEQQGVKIPAPGAVMFLACDGAQAAP